MNITDFSTQSLIKAIDQINSQQYDTEYEFKRGSFALDVSKRIASLEAEVERLKDEIEQLKVDSSAARRLITSYIRESNYFSQQNAELTKQRDGLLSVMRRAVVAGAHPSIQAKEDCYNILDEALRKIAIASEKEET